MSPNFSSGRFGLTMPVPDYHLICATKDRDTLISPEVEPVLYGYMIGKAHALESITHAKCLVGSAAMTFSLLEVLSLALLTTASEYTAASFRPPAARPHRPGARRRRATDSRAAPPARR